MKAFTLTYQGKSVEIEVINRFDVNEGILINDKPKKRSKNEKPLSKHICRRILLKRRKKCLILIKSEKLLTPRKARIY